MKNIKKIVVWKTMTELLQRMGRVFRFILVCFFISLFLLWWFDKDGSCLDTGGVWDGNEKRCRQDCLTWNEVDGCVPLK
ncbi:MAG: hypothetical protein NC218_11060 [Acetobacter sp.]|nr:hypothetical protein [Acetobacter sp.]